MKLKKIIVIICIFILVFLIYLTTIDRKIYYLNIGDNLSTSTKYSDEISKYLYSKHKLEKTIEFISNDYRTTDLIRDIKDNKVIKINNKNQTIKNALIKADLLTISIGKNDIYYKLTSNDLDKIYDYADSIISDIRNLLTIIREYCKEDIIFIGIIDYNTNYPEVIDYINNKIKIICNRNKINFIDINKYFIESDINNNNISNSGSKKLVLNLKKIINKTTLK